MSKKGFTLIEISAAIGIAGTMAVVSSQEDRLHNMQLNAQALGNEIYQYNVAVGELISTYSGKPENIAGWNTSSNNTIQSGAEWLKGPACGSSVGNGSFLHCDALPSGHTVRLNLEPRTEVSLDTDGNLIAKTIWIPMMNTDDMALSLGTAALVASGNYVGDRDNPLSGHHSPTVYCPDMTSFSADMMSTCSGNQNRIVSTVSTNPDNDVWLRTDHGNTMKHVIEFDDGSGTPTTNAALAGVDNTNWRQIVNVSRIYNIGGSGNDSLILGKLHGNNVYSDSFVTTQNLLNDAVIIDGNMGVMGDFYARADAIINGDITTQGAISAQGDITSSSNIAAANNISSGNNISAARSVSAGTDIFAGRDVNAARDVRSRDVISSRNIQAGNSIRSLGSLRVDGESNFSGDVRARNRLTIDGLLDANGALRVSGNTIGQSYIRSNSYLQGNQLKLSTSQVEGRSCSTGSVGRTSNGTLLNCTWGRWRVAGTKATSCPRNATRTRWIGGKKCYEFCPHDQSGWRRVGCS